MFRLFLKLNIFGRILAELLLLVFFVCLFFPVFPSLGIFNPADSGLHYKHYGQLLSKTHLPFLIEGLTFSFATGYFCTIFGFVIAYLTHKPFTGKFLFLSAISFFLIAPESLQLMIASPLLGFVFKTKGPIVEITYISSFLFLTSISILSSYALMSKVSKFELEAMNNLGASPIQIFTKYILPMGKKMIFQLGFALSCQVMFFGTHTKFIANPSKHSFVWNLSGPYYLYNDLGLPSSSYVLLLILFLLSVLPSFWFINKEFKGSTQSINQKGKPVNKSTRKKVTRKLPKKKKKTKAVDKPKEDPPIEEGSDQEETTVEGEE
ncbi:MAG: hypothetical protein KC646_16200 [Candidatus Cloacimonetes bacterium]|nr:hypothetical protein [Candidatus Cloacimonadota bacterium]